MTACNFRTVCNKCITRAVRWLFLNLSMTNLCALTIDRYFAIVSPFKYALLKAKKRHFFLLAAAWILPFVAHFAPFTWICTAETKSALRIFLMVMLVTFKLLPFLLLLTASSTSLYTTNRQRKQARNQLSQLQFNGSISPEHMNKHRSQTQASTFAKVLEIIVAICLVSYAIDIVRLICYIFHCKNDIPLLLARVQELLFICNSASNPLVYSFLKKDIRNELKRVIKNLLSCKFCKFA